MKVLITEKLSEHRYRTPEGYLVCVDAILARTGKQVYKHNQVYDGSTDEITDVEVDRKPEQVFSPQAIASFENKPLTIQHPNEPVTIANHKALYHGFARDIRRAVKRNGQILTGSKRPTQLQDGDQELLVGNIIVTTSEAIEEIDNGLEFLSCGYDCDITQTDTPEQINIRGNHIALCDNPRAGITMLQDNVELAELPVKHIVKVLTDAVIEQANKVRMNDEGRIVNTKIWNPDFYFKKETGYDEARTKIRTALQNAELTVEELTLSVYGSVIRFNKNMKLDSAQMKAFIGQLLAKINPALRVEKLRSMAGKITFEITGYEYLKKYLKDSVDDGEIEKAWLALSERQSIDARLRTMKTWFPNVKASKIKELVGQYDYVTNEEIKKYFHDAINYIVMCEQLYNGVAVKSRAPWIVFRTEDKAKAEQFVKENNAKTKSLVGFSQHYYIK